MSDRDSNLFIIKQIVQDLHLSSTEICVYVIWLWRWMKAYLHMLRRMPGYIKRKNISFKNKAVHNPYGEKKPHRIIYRKIIEAV